MLRLKKLVPDCITKNMVVLPINSQKLSKILALT